MMRLITLSVFSIFYLSIAAQPGTLLSQFGEDGIFTLDLTGEDEIQDITALADGSIIIAGYLNNTSQGTDYDGYLARIDETGSIMWSQEVDVYGVGSSDIFASLSIWDDKIYVQSNSRNIVNSNLDVVVLKYDLLGNQDLSFGDDGLGVASSGPGIAGFGMQVDEAGNIVVSGRKLQFNTTLEDGIVIKFTENGELDTAFGNDGISIQAVGSFRTGLLESAVINDHIYASGWFWDSGTAVATDENGLVFKIGSDGERDLTFATNGILNIDINGGELVTDIVQHGEDHFLVVLESGNGDDDIYVQRYDLDGNKDMTFGTDGTVVTDLGDDDDPDQIMVRDDLGFYVAASVNDEEDFALVSYKADGSMDTDFGLMGSVVINIDRNDNLSAAVLLENGNIALGGESNEENSPDFAVVVIEGYPTCMNSEESESISNCGPFTYNGQEFTESGFFSFNLTNVAGCDSTVTLTLTILESSQEEVSLTDCAPIEVNGISYNETGMYTQELMNVSGCDSTLTISFVKLESSEEALTIITCKPVTENGIEYTEEGLYQQVLSNASGCDSVLSIQITAPEAEVEIAMVDGVLSTNMVGAYQWINCDDNSAIEGATDSTFLPSESGNYALVLSDGLCMGSSNCVEVIISSLAGIGEKVATQVSPNPFQDYLILRSPTAESARMYDLSGRLVHSLAGEKRINTAMLESGMYMLHIQHTDGGSEVVKVLKQ